jgi:hypothetical protein
MNATPSLQPSNPPPPLPRQSEATAGPPLAEGEMQSLLTDIRSSWSSISPVPGELKTVRESTDKLANELRDVRQQLLARQTIMVPRRAGQVSDSCARHIASTFILHCERSDKLHALCSVPEAVPGHGSSQIQITPAPVSASGSVR